MGNEELGERITGLVRTYILQEVIARAVEARIISIKDNFKIEIYKC
jgi:hypothetical protein